jgi:hypothetical protein
MPIRIQQAELAPLSANRITAVMQNGLLHMKLFINCVVEISKRSCLNPRDKGLYLLFYKKCCCYRLCFVQPPSCYQYKVISFKVQNCITEVRHPFLLKGTVTPAQNGLKVVWLEKFAGL